MTDLSLHQRFEPRVVDLFARTQQAGPRPRPAVSRGASPLSSDGRRLTISPSRRARIRIDFGMRLRLERRRRHHHARDRLVPPREIADHILDVVDPAEHGNIADQLPAIGRRRRQHADRPEPLDRAALDAAQAGSPHRRRGRSTASATRLRCGHDGGPGCSENSDRRSASALRKNTSRNQ